MEFCPAYGSLRRAAARQDVARTGQGCIRVGVGFGANTGTYGWERDSGGKEGG